MATRYERLTRTLGSLLAPREPDIQEVLYGRENGESLFEIFLKNSTQKKVLAAHLAERVMRADPRGQLNILDIGTSKGTLMNMFAGELTDRGLRAPVHFHFIEPDSDSVEHLATTAENLRDYSRGRYDATITQATWQDFVPSGSLFDAVICSHTIYHFPREEFPLLFQKMTDLITPGGQVFVIARTMDPIYNFIRLFYTPATGKPFNEITIEDAKDPLAQIAGADPTLRYHYEESQATVRFPFASKPEDARKLAGFFLQQPWEKIPSHVQGDIEGYLKGLGEDSYDIIVPQIDGIARVIRNGNNGGLTNR